MILSSGTKKPKIHSSAYVAASATISGDVMIDAGCVILHGAIVVSEGAPITIGAETVVMENAVIKASGGKALEFPVEIGARSIIGPLALVVGATIGKGVLVAGGAKVYNGSVLAEGARVEANSVVGGGGTFFERVFNVDDGPGATARAAESYSKFLRKTHAQDAIVGDGTHVTKVAPQRIEPKPAPVAELGGVDDAMMLELREMEQQRLASQARKKK
jgi:carbonic anhydrase/acetyltransferase-like protein (isoleucine patch superfamily)